MSKDYTLAQSIFCYSSYQQQGLAGATLSLTPPQFSKVQESTTPLQQIYDTVNESIMIYNETKKLSWDASMLIRNNYSSITITISMHRYLLNAKEVYSRSYSFPLLIVVAAATFSQSEQHHLLLPLFFLKARGRTK